MVTVALAEAQARLGELIERAEAGEAVAITRPGKPAVRLVAEGESEKALKPEHLERMREIASRFEPFVDPEGLSFVERMRREDRL
jgi:prevent-host-death family protein